MSKCSVCSTEKEFIMAWYQGALICFKCLAENFPHQAEIVSNYLKEHKTSDTKKRDYHEHQGRNEKR